MPAYLIGIVFGCSYFTFKHEQGFRAGIPRNHGIRSELEEDPAVVYGERDPEPNMLIAIFEKLKERPYISMTAIVLGWSFKGLLVMFLSIINNLGYDVPLPINMMYLLFQRPLFVTGIAFSVMPFILNIPYFRPMTQFLSASFWFPLSRLTYGAYLSHCVFVLFQQYNAERGTWLCNFDTFLLFFAYLTFAFCFSFLATTIVEMPCHKLYKDFALDESGFNDLFWKNEDF